jgi:hypothetical protein|tara:strand:+ start:171 stop:515 length:345 start_codon:yes stop_codon:yes gene_type:complete
MKHTKELLMKSRVLVGGDREKDYGDKVKNHNNIAKLWSAYLDVPVTAHDVAIMMTLLKVARTKLGEVSEDTYVDMAAYGAIAGEIKFKEPKKESEGERRGRETREHIKTLNKEK